MEYDIIHVDDSKDELKNMARAANEIGFSYQGVTNLRSLEGVLKESSARLYIVDGDFPELERSRVEFNAPKAINAIREKDESAKIVVFSGQPGYKKDAWKLDAEFRQKGVYTSRQFLAEFADKLKK